MLYQTQSKQYNAMTYSSFGTRKSSKTNLFSQNRISLVLALIMLPSVNVLAASFSTKASSTKSPPPKSIPNSTPKLDVFSIPTRPDVTKPNPKAFDQAEVVKKFDERKLEFSKAKQAFRKE